MENIYLSTPITISNADCTWNPRERAITVKGSVSGTIPTEELGIRNIDSCNMVTDETTGTIMPQEISALLQQPFKVILTLSKDNSYVFSRRKYLEYCKDNLVIGEVYDAVISAVRPWGIFCKIGDATVLVHITNWSRCIFYNANSIASPGQIITVRILSKTKDADGFIRVVASRKDVGSNQLFHHGERVIVTLSHETSTGDGFFCELTPNLCGIVDVPSNDIPYLFCGMHALAVVKKLVPKGYKLKYLYSLTDNY